MVGNFDEVALCVYLAYVDIYRTHVTMSPRRAGRRQRLTKFSDTNSVVDWGRPEAT